MRVEQLGNIFARIVDGKGTMDNLKKIFQVLYKIYPKYKDWF